MAYSRAVKTGQAVRAGLKARKKWRAWAEKSQPESFQGFLARPDKARNPSGLARPGCGQPKSPQKKLKCVIFFLHWTGLLDVVTLLGVTFWIIKTFMLFQIISILNF